MNKGISLLLLALVTTPSLAGEVYRWVDPQGRVHYSDQPPPPTAKDSRQLSGKGNVVEVDKQSYDSRQAHARSPVVLYATGSCGVVCDDAKAHLSKRGVQFTVKDPAKDPEIAVELKKLVGAVEVPVVVVGKSHQKGFSAASWDGLLDSAGYPKP